MLVKILHAAKDKALSAKNWLVNQIDAPIIVLLYHRVNCLKDDAQLLAVSPKNFIEQIRIIKNSYPVLRFEEDWSNIKEPSVSITFDDGYADNYYEALPILEQEKVPATFFISSGFVYHGDEYWWDLIEKLVLLNNKFPASIILNGKKKWNTGNEKEKRLFYEEMLIMFQNLNTFQRKHYLQMLADLTGAALQPNPTNAPLNNEELKVFASHPMVTIGAHTVSHFRLSGLNVYDQTIEIFKSKEQLEEILKSPIEVFAYPFGGKKDYTNQTVNIVRKAGFKKAASNYPGQFHGWKDQFQIPRQLVRNWGPAEFKNRLSKFWLNGK